MSDSEPLSTFESLGLSAPLLKVLTDLGYEMPSPIQAEAIPHLIEGHDLIGQAQTGTGKTAAFALPVLMRLDLQPAQVQALVMTPTRELAIQVAEAFQSYAKYIPKFHVLPIYGGQAYTSQLRSLKRGVHVVVGTPGRLMDHMRRGTLKLDHLKTVVLDEADEMLRMGFIDDVQWVLEQLPKERQIALFSATMPDQIRKVARRHLHEPKEVKVKTKTETARTITQSFIRVHAGQKLDALTRILEFEDFSAILIFVRTKTATLELTQKLTARGYSCEALNGDITQRLREQTVERLKRGDIEIVVATDVAARGLDVERISHVINYDIPNDTESYVHRIGRTGRAGRAGQAILFVTPREQYLLKAIEKATRQSITMMQLPSNDVINQQRLQRFKDRILEAVKTEQQLDIYRPLIAEIVEEADLEINDVAAAIASLLQGNEPLLLTENLDSGHRGGREHGGRDHGAREQGRNTKKKSGRERERGRSSDHDKSFDVPMESYRLEIGRDDSVTPANIVGAIANEGGLESRHIGRIKINDDHSTVVLPAGMPKDVMSTLSKAWLCGKHMNLTRQGPAEAGDRRPKKTGFSGKSPRKGDTERSAKPKSEFKRRKPKT